MLPSSYVHSQVSICSFALLSLLVNLLEGQKREKLEKSLRREQKEQKLECAVFVLRFPPEIKVHPNIHKLPAAASVRTFLASFEESKNAR